MNQSLQELDLKQRDYIVHCDSQSVKDLSKNTMYHARTKHIGVRYHWIRKAIEEQLFQIRKIHTDENISDIMTKVIIKEKLAQCIKNTGMSSYYGVKKTPTSICLLHGSREGDLWGPAHKCCCSYSS